MLWEQLWSYRVFDPFQLELTQPIVECNNRLNRVNTLGFTSNRSNVFQWRITKYTLSTRTSDVRVDFIPFSDRQREKIIFGVISSAREYFKFIFACFKGFLVKERLLKKKEKFSIYFFFHFHHRNVCKNKTKLSSATNYICYCCCFITTTHSLAFS